MKYRLTAITAAMLLAACSSSAGTNHPNRQSDQKENKTMSNTEIKPKLTPRQLLTRLLTLLETSESVDDFTPKRLEEVLGVPVTMDKEDRDRYEFHEKVTKNWGYRFSIGTNISGTKQFLLSFNWLGDKNIAHPKMTDVCEMTTAEFITQARKSGFSDKPIRALGRAPILEGFALSKGKLKVEIRLAQGCIESIRVR